MIKIIHILLTFVRNCESTIDKSIFYLAKKLFSMDIKTIENYTEYLFKGLKLVLRPGLSISCEICPYPNGTAIILKFAPGDGTIRSFLEQKSLRGLLDYTGIGKIINVPDGKEPNITFSGTNIFWNGNTIVLLKDDDTAIWTAEAAGNDIKRIIGKE